MNKQKQIEEMAKILCELNCKYCENCFHLNQTEKIYNAGYRKIPEGSVVITKAEYNWLVNSDKEEIVKENEELGNQCLEWMELYHKQITKTEQARKQAVKEVIEKVKTRLEEYRLENEHFIPKEPNGNRWQMNSTYFWFNVIQDGALIDEIAKEFGVEIEQ